MVRLITLLILLCTIETSSSSDLETYQRVLMGKHRIQSNYWEVKWGLTNKILETRQDLIDRFYDDIINYTEDLNQYLSSEISASEETIKNIKAKELKQIEIILSLPHFKQHIYHQQTLHRLQNILLK